MTARTPEHDVKKSSTQSSDSASADHADDSANDGFLSRWSRQKNSARTSSDESDNVDASEQVQPTLDLEGRSGESADAGAQTDVSIDSNPLEENPQEDSPQAENPQEEQEVILTDADMPAVETLNQGSDYSGFLNKGVSPELRKRALRHLFSHAIFNERDGLNDYDEDYTTFEPLGDTVTSDMRWHKARKEREEAERLAAEQEQAEQQQQEEAARAQARDPEAESEESTADSANEDVEQADEVDQSANDDELDNQQHDPVPVDSTDSPEFADEYADGSESTLTQNAYADDGSETSRG